MEEDLDFNRFVKAALESGEAFARLPSVPRRSLLRYLAAPFLVAAALMGVAIFPLFVTERPDGVTEAIRLLSEADGLEIEDPGASAADLLLAWQDAPCRDLL